MMLPAAAGMRNVMLQPWPLSAVHQVLHHASCLTRSRLMQSCATHLLRTWPPRWCEAQGYKVRLVDRSPGEEAGLKSAELEVEGRFAYGYLKGEKGTHRWGARGCWRLHLLSPACCMLVPARRPSMPPALPWQPAADAMRNETMRHGPVASQCLCASAVPSAPCWPRTCMQAGAQLPLQCQGPPAD